MPCPLCGDICRCSTDAYSAASPRWLPDGEACPATAAPHAGLETPGAEAPGLHPAAEASTPDDSAESAPEDSLAWRQEVAARLNRYQARRKPRPPRYPSLRLRFEDEATRVRPESSVFPQVLASNQALALVGFAAAVPVSEPLNVPETDRKSV